MPKLLLHIGTHKTGTTSIQRFCAANRNALRDHGLWYPPADVGKFPKHYAHHRVAHSIALRDPDFGPDDASHFFDRVRRQLGNDETAVISAEPMYRHLLADGEPARGLLKLSAEETERQFRNYAAATQEAIGDFDVTVLVMLRRQDLFLESLYAEQVLSTGYNRTIERFAVERRALLDYAARLTGWAEVFGASNLSVKVFERSKLTVPIERTFIEWAGLDWQDSFDLGRPHNVTPSRTFVEFKRLMNQRTQSGAVNTVFRSWVEKLAQSDHEFPDLGRYYLQPADRVELCQQFDPGNRSVARQYCERDRLFDDDVHDELVKYRDRPRLTDKDFRLMARELFAAIAETQRAD